MFKIIEKYLINQIVNQLKHDLAETLTSYSIQIKQNKESYQFNDKYILEITKIKERFYSKTYTNKSITTCFSEMLLHYNDTLAEIRTMFRGE
jgi:hypothetical protein